MLLALSDRNVPAEVYIASIRAKHEYGLAARGLEAAKRRAGMAFRVLERAVYHSGSIAAHEAALKVVSQVRASTPPPEPGLAVAAELPDAPVEQNGLK